MAPLIAAALGLAPVLLDALVGPKAGQVAAQVTDVVRTVAGTDDPAVIAGLPPEKKAELQQRLAEIALETRRADLADVANARQQTVTLAQAGSPMAWGAAVVTMVLTALFAAAMLATWGGWPPLDAGMAETVKTLFIAACSYWIGSSRGSAVKDERASTAPPPTAIAPVVVTAPQPDPDATPDALMDRYNPRPR